MKQAAKEVFENNMHHHDCVLNNSQQSGFADQMYKTFRHFSLDFGENI